MTFKWWDMWYSSFYLSRKVHHLKLNFCLRTIVRTFEPLSFQDIYVFNIWLEISCDPYKLINSQFWIWWNINIVSNFIFRTLSKALALEDYGIDSPMMEHRQHHPLGQTELAVQLGVHMKFNKSATSFEHYLYMTQVWSMYQ